SHSIDGAGVTLRAADQIVESAIRSDLQVHRHGDVRGKGDDVVVGRVEAPDPTAAKIREEIAVVILGRKLDRVWGVEGGAADSAAIVLVSVGVCRGAETRIRSRAVGGGPAVVGTGGS